jgi:hypothetical protein
MELVSDLVKILLPSVLVMYVMYLTIKAFINKDIQQLRESQEAQVQLKMADLEIKKTEIELKYKEQVLPIRLQAYERMCLFLERISPPQLIPRLNNNQFSVGLFQQVLIQEIRNEFGHNLSQQMYISSNAWMLIKKAMEETILLINNTTVALDEDAQGIMLAKGVLENVRDHGIHTTEAALDFLKDEIQQFF